MQKLYSKKNSRRERKKKRELKKNRTRTEEAEHPERFAETLEHPTEKVQRENFIFG